MNQEDFSWFEELINDFPYSVLLVNQQLKILKKNHVAKITFPDSESQQNYLEHFFSISTFTKLLDFKKKMQKEPFAQIEIKLESLGDTLLLGKICTTKKHYLIAAFPVKYKELFQNLLNRYNTLLYYLPVGIIMTDAEYKIVDVNPAFTKLTGYNNQESRGKKLSILKSGIHQDDFYKKLYQELNERGLFSGEIIDRNKKGELIHLQTTIFPIYDINHEIVNFIGIQLDISQIRFLQKKMATHSRLDPLTRLNNRESFLNVLEVKLDFVNENNKLALFFIDLNRFKLINDTFGHDQGDIILAQAASRIKQSLRGNDLIGRFGGDEFLVLIERIDYKSARKIAKKIAEEISKPYQINDKVIDFISGSIGIAFAPDDAKKSSELLRKADAAMYASKQNSSTSQVVFATSLQEKDMQTKTLCTELLGAIENEEIYIRIQPIVDIESKKIIGGEILGRWLNLKFNEVRPDVFFDFAEKIGISNKLNNYIIQEVLNFLHKYDLDDNIFIDINFSAEEFSNIHFIDNIKTLFDAEPLLKKHIVVEITEHTMINNVYLTTKHLSALREMGIKIAIDDFGTGFSSLAYLKNFSIDFLKIDKSFIDNIESQSKDADIVNAIITMAHAIGAKTVVEGVERETQYLKLKKLGADHIQGFYFYKPLLPEVFIEEIHLQNF